MTHTFQCWRCGQIVHPRDMLRRSEYYEYNHDEIQMAELCCEAEVCESCLWEIDEISQDGDF